MAPSEHFQDTGERFDRDRGIAATSGVARGAHPAEPGSTPLLDRLMHHGHLLKFVGQSWRLKESAEHLAKAGQTA
jgi:hypothetical protein